MRKGIIASIINNINTNVRGNKCIYSIVRRIIKIGYIMHNIQ